MAARILVVDDEKINVDLLEGHLSKDYEVVTAYSGKEALQKVEQTSPDLILLDVLMPDITGFDVCRKLKSDAKNLSIPVVMVTTLTEKEYKIKAIEAGADDFLNKPVDFNELSARVKSLLRVKQYHDMLTEANKKILHLAEEKYRSLFDNSSDAIIICDVDEKVNSWNRSAERMFGWRAEEVKGKDISKLIIPSEKYAKWENIVEDVISGKELTGIETVCRRKNGTSVDVSVTISLLSDADQKIIGMAGIIRDITERRHAEEQIRASLAEKEVLLKEIHHRVKNNMQVISSLLRLQSSYIKNKKYLDIFKESQNRIESMSLIHEKLYQSKDMARIDFNGYVRELINGLFQTYGVNSNNLALNIDIESISLGIDSAIPCGLIINELVTNSLKHAFPEGRKGEINVALHRDENRIELLISDNGVGIPKEIDFRKTESLGLYLVKILAENQLQGEINLNRNRGTEFQIKFKEGK